MNLRRARNEAEQTLREAASFRGTTITAMSEPSVIKGSVRIDARGANGDRYEASAGEIKGHVGAVVKTTP